MIKWHVSKCILLCWGKKSINANERNYKKKKGKMFVYEETRQTQKEKNKINTLTLQRGWGGGVSPPKVPRCSG